MTVCFYFGVFARVGGIEAFTKALALTLLQNGIKVEIICASQNHRVLQDLQDAGATVTRIPVYYGCRWHVPDLALLPFALRGIRRANIVIHQKPFIPFFYRLLSRKPRHIYVTAYRPAEQFPCPTERFQFFSFFDAVLTQTKAFQDDLLSCNVTSPVSVIPYIPPAIYDVSIQHSGSDRVLKVGIVGRLERQKNPDYAFSIVKTLHDSLTKEGREVELNVYGTGSLEAGLRESAETCPFAIIFHGEYHRTEVPRIVGENDVFLNTSISEGQCIVALEILAGGRPLFATPAGALPEILAHDILGAVIPSDNADAAALVLLNWLASHPHITPESIQRSYLSAYDQNRVKQEYVTLIRKLHETQ